MFALDMDIKVRVRLLIDEESGKEMLEKLNQGATIMTAYKETFEAEIDPDDFEMDCDSIQYLEPQSTRTSTIDLIDVKNRDVVWDNRIID